MIQKSDTDVNHRLIDMINHIYDNPPPDGVDIPLAMLSKRDAVWDNHRSDSQDVASMYLHSTDYVKYSERMSECSTYLDFAITDDGLKLQRSFFCHVRNCPVCQWRKSLYWKAMMYKTYDRLKDDYASHRWLFLTLTVQNCHITDLRGTLQLMHNAFVKLTKRKQFGKVAGFVRTTEVTRDKKRSTTHAHPHYHCLLVVEPDYFSKHHYIKHSDWVRLWQECLKSPYSPNVDIRIVRSNDGSHHALRGAIAETLKYACKPSDMIGDGTAQSRQWFLEYTKQVHKMRFVNSGGILKDALKSERDVTDADMIVLGDDVDDATNDADNRLMSFNYYPTKRSYLYNHWGNR